jgi:hypothetical protein
VLGDRSGIDQAVRDQLTVGNAPSAIQMGSPGNVAALEGAVSREYSMSLIPRKTHHEGTGLHHHLPHASLAQRPPSKAAGGEQ